MKPKLAMEVAVIGDVDVFGDDGKIEVVGSRSIGC